MDRKVLEDLAERVERSADQVQAEIETLMRTGNYSETGAVVVWKSQNKFALSSGKPQELKVRVIARENPRTTHVSSGESQVANLDVIYTDEDGKTDFAKVALWGDRADVASMVRIGSTYKVVARIQAGASQTKLTAFELLEELDDAAVTSLAAMEESGWEFGNLASIDEFVDSEEVFKGTVGKPILASGSGDKIGIEISNAWDSSVPITVWAGRGRDNPAVEEIQDLLQDLNEGDDVYVFGYVNSKDDGSIQINASGIFRA
jgi:hypothetical protein